MTTTAQAKRVPTLDAARFFAAFGVIWIHVCQTPATVSFGAFGRFAVPFFAATAGYFLVQSLQHKPDLRLRSFAASRLTRLYLPFLAWSGIYWAFKLTKTQFVEDSDTIVPGIEILYEGGAYHLWFIPYLILASLLVYGMSHYIAFASQNLRSLAVFTASAGLLLAMLLRTWHPVEATAYFMLMATPSLLWGCALGWLQIDSKNQTGRPCLQSSTPATTIFLLGVFVVAAIIPTGMMRSSLLENAAGIALLLLAIYSGLLLQKSSKTIDLISRLGQVSLGIYFSHLLFIKAGEALLNQWSANYGLTMAICLTTIVTILATTCSLIAAKYRFSRWLVA